MTNLEMTLAKDISAKLKDQIPTIRTRIRSSNQSRSVYMYAINRNKALGIRISDHVDYLPPQRVKFETRRNQVDVMYLYTRDSQEGNKNFHVSSIDELTKAVLEYFSVPSS